MPSPASDALSAVPIAEILHSTFGIGNADPTPASNGLAVFLLGLVAGIVAAVAAFFIYLHFRKAQRHRTDLGIEDLQSQLEKLDLEEPNPRSSSQESHQPQEQQPPRAPWEKPDDWWKGSSS